jgi:nicotinamide-nucleotide amidase
MKATIINIANEVLNGSTINTNATFLSLELGKLGYEVNEVLAIADGYNALSRTLD